MRGFLLSLFLLFLWMLLGATYLGEKICGKSDPPATITEVVPPVREPISNSFSVSTDAGILATAANGYYFLKDGAIPNMENDMEQLLDKVAIHLKDNPNAQLSLVGSYEASETNQTDYPNLGLARAISIQEMLLKKGVSEKQLLVSGNNNQINWNENRLYNGVAFGISTAKVDETFSDAELLKTMNEPQFVYFKTSKQSVLISPQLQSYLNQVKIFSERYPEAQIYLTGHTDNTGKIEVNTRLGRKRAEFIRDYMQELGINASINVNSEGPNEPIADNETSEGRAKNRRVEIKVIK